MVALRNEPKPKDRPKRYDFLVRLVEWIDEQKAAGREGTPDIAGFWRTIGGKKKISYKCFYVLHYTKLVEEGLIIDYVDPETKARALMVTEEARSFK